MRSPLITPHLLAQAREGAQDPLTRAVLEILRRALVSHWVPAQDVEDLLQHKAPKIVKILIEGRAAPGKEDAYVWRCGETTAISYFRKQKRHFVGFEEDALQQQEQGEDAEDAEEREGRLQEQVQALREVLEGEELSAEDRALLRHVYVLETPIEKLAEEELRRNPTVLRGARTGEPRTLAEARNSVDQRLTRARKRLGEILRRRLS